MDSVSYADYDLVIVGSGFFGLTVESASGLLSFRERFWAHFNFKLGRAVDGGIVLECARRL